VSYAVQTSGARPPGQSTGLADQLALAGIVGPVVFVIAFTAAGIARASYSPVHQPISDLGVGQNAWLVDGACVLLWLLLTAFVIAFYRAMRTVMGQGLAGICAALLEVSPLGFGLAGVFTEDPSTLRIHITAAFLAFLGPAVAFFVTALLLRRSSSWSSLAAYSFTASLATLVLVAFMNLLVFRPGSPLASARLGGLTERVVVIEVLAWYVVAGWWLYRAGPTANRRRLPTAKNGG
jgi:hypothetical membrane protein